jgi:hypothetical protein
LGCFVEKKRFLGKLVMKAKSVVLAGIGCLLVFLAGCGRPDVKQSIQTMDSNAPTAGEAATAQTTDSNTPAVIWDGTPPKQEAMPDFFEGQPVSSEFPESMVGVWAVVLNEELESKWSIKFEPDGSIKKIMHSVAGPVVIADGGVSGNGPDPCTYYIFSMGPCEARYIPKTRMIKVKIIVDYFMMKLPSGEVEGRLEDYIEGPVSEDGKTWNVKWLNFGLIKDAAIPDINVIKADPQPLVFQKVEGDTLKMTEEPNKAADSNVSAGHTTTTAGKPAQ